MNGLIGAADDDAEDLLPEEQQAEQRRLEDARLSRIATLTQSLISKRTDAISFRAASGIEEEWSDCEDAYEGIDDANRATESPASVRMQKPRSAEGGAIGAKKRASTRSTVFLNITRPYTDAAAARVSDMLIPADERNFNLRPTPIPEMAGVPVMDGRPEITPEELEAFRARLMDDAKKRADAAQTRIDDWLTEGLYRPEVRKVIESCARLGTGILKGPTPVRIKRKVVSRGQLGLELKVLEEINPQSREVSPWNFFPDPACGENVNNGSYVFERDRLGARMVRDLMKQPGYLADQIEACLTEGPGRINTTNTERFTRETDTFEVWYFTGEITRDDIVAVYPGRQIDTDAVKVVCTIINDRIVKIARDPLECDGFGYDVMPWQRRAGFWAGIGIAYQISVPQRMLNSATRNMNDNAALSGGPQIVMLKGVVEPADGVFELVPRKFWLADAETSVDDLKKAFLAIDIPTRQTELMNIIQFALKIAEDVTGLPMLMQGNQGKAPDTVGGMEILNQNANTVLRRIARTFDESITEPHIRRYYDWIMAFGEESEKGDFSIVATGSTSLVERDIQRQAILAMGQLVLDQRYGLDPELWAEEALRANKIDPKKLKLSDAKKAEAQAQQQRQQALEQVLIQAKQQLDQQKMQQAAALQVRQQNIDLQKNNDDNATNVAVAAIRHSSTHPPESAAPSIQEAVAA